MPLIWVKGVQFANKGAALMFEAVREQLLQRYPNVRLALEHNPNLGDAERLKYQALRKVSWRKNRLDFNALCYRFSPKARQFLCLNRSDWVTEADIDAVLDMSGFAYGDAWGHLKARHLQGEVERLTAQGKPYVFLPQAFGAFERPEIRNPVKTALQQAALVIAREAQSEQYVRQLLTDNESPEAANLHCFPDFTNLIQPAADSATSGQSHTPESDYVLLIPNQQMESKRNQRTEWAGRYFQVMVNCGMAAHELGLVPVVMNHEGRADADLCSKLHKHLSELTGLELPLLEPESALETKALIGSSNAVVSSRFHGCVSALAQQVPCLGTSWSHKYEQLFADYERSEYLLTANCTQAEAKQLLQQARHHVSDTSYVTAVNEQKLASERMWQQVFKVLEAAHV